MPLRRRRLRSFFARLFGYKKVHVDTERSMGTRRNKTVAPLEQYGGKMWYPIKSTVFKEPWDEDDDEYSFDDFIKDRISNESTVKRINQENNIKIKGHYFISYECFHFQTYSTVWVALIFRCS